MKKITQILTIAVAFVISNEANGQSVTEAELSSNHSPIENSLESVMKLNPVKVTFNLKKHQALGVLQDTQVGFRVDAVKSIFPEAIVTEQKIIPTGKNDHKTLTSERVDLIKLIPYLVQAIKEQQELIELLRKELQTMKSSVSGAK